MACQVSDEHLVDMTVSQFAAPYPYVVAYAARRMRWWSRGCAQPCQPWGHVAERGS